MKITKKNAYLYSNLTISTFNGCLYFVIAVKGGNDLAALFSINKDAIICISVGASIVYTMFTYKTIQSLSLKANTPSKIFFSSLAPFSASAFLTGGISGSKQLGFSQEMATAIGVMLFLLRMINCVDASVKFPERLTETSEAWSDAYTNKNYVEMSRLIIVWLSSLGYVFCTTDTIYNSTSTIANWLKITKSAVPAISASAAGLGALGTLPLNIYWSYRGLRQLTYGGKPNEDGINLDPSDRFTFLGLLLVLPITLGILGGATAGTGKAAAQLGETTVILRIITSFLYACFAGTPGMASLLRNTTTSIYNFYNKKKSAATLKEPLLPGHDKSNASWCHWFSKGNKTNQNISLSSVVGENPMITEQQFPQNNFS